jgi:hypothetical protein
VGCPDFEGDAAAVDGDREGEELAAVLLGGSEPRQASAPSGNPGRRSNKATMWSGTSTWASVARASTTCRVSPTSALRKAAMSWLTRMAVGSSRRARKASSGLPSVKRLPVNGATRCEALHRR